MEGGTQKKEVEGDAQKKAPLSTEHQEWQLLQEEGGGGGAAPPTEQQVLDNKSAEKSGGDQETAEDITKQVSMQASSLSLPLGYELK